MNRVIIYNDTNHVRLNGDTVWLPATINGTGYNHLQCRALLCISEPTSVKDIKLHLEGRYHNKYIQDEQKLYFWIMT